ncbi:MAG: serine/threonine-protein phosphatase [Phycisphaerae bacterium]|nr:serine/threonine-protein phosphatase [Phycisphaerae bacterium]
MVQAESPGSSIDHAESSARRIACMEVWGGHEGFAGEVSVPGNDVFVGCEPHTGDSHGGDIYYVSNCAAGLITRFVLADVSGHGSIVAEAASGLRNLMRRFINTPDQSRFARALNKSFSNQSGLFATAILVSYFAPSDHAIICNAGHPRPLHFSVSKQGWQYLDHDSSGVVKPQQARAVGVSNLPLGVISPTQYEQFALPLERGDLLVLYSDAFLEVRGSDGKPWGEDALLNIVRRIDTTDPANFRSNLLNLILTESGETRLDDDVTMIVLHHNASDPPRQGLLERAVVLGKVLGLVAS